MSLKFLAGKALWQQNFRTLESLKNESYLWPQNTGDVNAKNFMRNKAINSKMSQRDLEHIIALYDGEIRFTDEIIDIERTELCFVTV